MKGAILIGGRSRRMAGPDKATLRRNGERVLERTLRQLRSVCGEVLLVARDAEHAAEFQKLTLATTVVDQVPDCGPLAGLVSAIDAACDDIFLLGCDMPYVESSLLQKIALEFLHHRPLALVPLSPRESALGATKGIVEWQAEPLCSVWSADCIEAARAALERRSLALTAFAQNIDARYVRLTSGESALLRNINTPEDIAASGGELSFG
jgi:molybdenum cofactor guanylyltransferase